MPKSPSRPKSPRRRRGSTDSVDLNPYMRFYVERYGQVKQDHGNVRDAAHAVAREWKALSHDDRQKYQEAADEVRAAKRALSFFDTPGAVETKSVTVKSDASTKVPSKRPSAANVATPVANNQPPAASELPIEREEAQVESEAPPVTSAPLSVEEAPTSGDGSTTAANVTTEADTAVTATAEDQMPSPATTETPPIAQPADA